MKGADYSAPFFRWYVSCSYLKKYFLAGIPHGNCVCCCRPKRQTMKIQLIRHFAAQGQVNENEGTKIRIHRTCNVRWGYQSLQMHRIEQSNCKSAFQLRRTMPVYSWTWKIKTVVGCNIYYSRAYAYGNKDMWKTAIDLTTDGILRKQTSANAKGRHTSGEKNDQFDLLKNVQCQNSV